MSMPICECRWLIADRLRRPFYRRGLKIGDSIDIRSAAAKNNRRVEKVGAEMLCIKKPVRVLRLSRCRDRALRSTQANKTGKDSGYPHRQIVWAPQQERYSPNQSDHRRDLERRHQDQKPLDQGFAVRLVQTQNMEQIDDVPA